MREVVFILLVLLVIFGLTAYRYRRQLAFALQIWRALKRAREMQAGSATQMPSHAPEEVPMGELVNCGKCGKWTSAETAIKFGPTIYYCSTKCLHNKARV